MTSWWLVSSVMILTRPECRCGAPRLSPADLRLKRDFDPRFRGPSLEWFSKRTGLDLNFVRAKSRLLVRRKNFLVEHCVALEVCSCSSDRGEAELANRQISPAPGDFLNQHRRRQTSPRDRRPIDRSFRKRSIRLNPEPPPPPQGHDGVGR